MSEPAATPVLSARGVTKQFGGEASGAIVEVLRGIDFDLAEGRTASIVGASGSGKSTFLNIAGTLDQPTSGTVLLAGADVAGLPDRALARLRATFLGFVFQFHHLLPQCTVLENVLVPTLAERATPRREPVEDRARRLLARVGLSERQDHRPGQLSGGERQRAAVVRAMINEPALLLADEPTGSLDRAASDNLGELLFDLNREEGVAILLITHAPELARRCTEMYELTDGTLRRTG